MGRKLKPKEVKKMVKETEEEKKVQEEREFIRLQEFEDRVKILNGIRKRLFKLYGEFEEKEVESTMEYIIGKRELLRGLKEEEERQDGFDKMLDEERERIRKTSITMMDGNHVKQETLEKLKRKKERELEREALKKAMEEEENKEDSGKKKNKSKEEEVEKKKPGSHLIPKEKVSYPQELLKHPKLGPALKLHEKGGDEGKKGRKILRGLGFKLSDESTWAPFIKEVSKKKK